MLVLLTLVLGVAYPLALVGVGRLVAPAQAAGSLVRDTNGSVVGSALIGQSFLDAEGKPDVRFFQPRPSAAGDGYDSMSSSGSNLGPSNPELVELIKQRRAEIAEREGVDVEQVPADAVTASASGLDPDISPDYARLQAARVAKERGLSVDEVQALIDRTVQRTGPWLPGQDRVNVLALNMGLNELAPLR